MPIYAGNREYEALLGAMKDVTPPCTDDDKYTADEISPRDQVRMAGICRQCPVRDLCAAYAAKAKPTGGYWAGKDRTVRERNTE